MQGLAAITVGVLLGDLLPEAGQAIEFVRDAGGRVSWIRMTGRVAAKTP